MPFIASCPPWMAPISPVTPGIAGRAPVAAAGATDCIAPPGAPLTCSCCCTDGGEPWPTEGGVERAELLLRLLEALSCQGEDKGGRAQRGGEFQTGATPKASRGHTWAARGRGRGRAESGRNVPPS